MNLNNPPTIRAATESARKFWKQQGIILIHLSILISILSLLLITQIHGIALYLASERAFKHRQQAYKELEQTANHFLHYHQDFSKNCLIHPMDTENIKKRLQRSDACSLEHHQKNYHFLIEDLGAFPCLKTFNNNAAAGTKHWRLHLMWADREPLFLQLRFAREIELKDENKACSSENIKFIHPGVLNWLRG